jgi:predicted HicB family RNase H-like nuclease
MSTDLAPQRLQVRVPGELFMRVKREAAKQKRSIPALVRLILTEYLDRPRAKP